jgi:hypothetical protein
MNEDEEELFLILFDMVEEWLFLNDENGRFDEHF